MRTEEDWNQRVKAKYLANYPPRLQKDLLEIHIPDTFPTEVQSLYIWGDKNTGKTVYAAQLMLLEQKNIYLSGGPLDTWHKCEFITTVDLVDKIKASYEKNSTGMTEQELLLHYQNIHLLVLDDFGTVKPTDWAMHIFYSIINHRYDYLKKTIITSNEALADLAKTFEDSRITSRIERMCLVKRKTPYTK